jgi:hypothetical protein
MLLFSTQQSTSWFRARMSPVNLEELAQGVWMYRTLGEGGEAVTEPRRFPPPWDIEEYGQSCFVVCDNNRTASAYVYYDSQLGSPGPPSSCLWIDPDQNSFLKDRLKDQWGLVTRAKRSSPNRTERSL